MYVIAAYLFFCAEARVVSAFYVGRVSTAAMNFAWSKSNGRPRGLRRSRNSPHLIACRVGEPPRNERPNWTTMAMQSHTWDSHLHLVARRSHCFCLYILWCKWENGWSFMVWVWNFCMEGIKILNYQDINICTTYTKYTLRIRICKKRKVYIWSSDITAMH